MSESINARNIDALHQALKEQKREIAELKEQLARLGNTVAFLQADVSNTKQLVAHVTGRGMGATVN
jgi:uncharacterized coiled-coil protein SlyX